MYSENHSQANCSGDNVRAVPFCAGDEAASWSSKDWAFKAGLKGFDDDEGTNVLLFGMPESAGAADVALQAIDDSFPLTRKLGGIAGGAQGRRDERCLIYRKGCAVVNRKGQLIHGEDKETAKYSSSDDLFFDGGSWRKSGLVGAALIGTTSDLLTVQGARCTSSLFEVTETADRGSVIVKVAAGSAPATALELDGGEGLVGFSLLPHEEESVDPPCFNFVHGRAEEAGQVRLADNVRVEVGDLVAAATKCDGGEEIAAGLGRLAAAKAVRDGEGHAVVGALALCDRAAWERQAGDKGVSRRLKETLNAPIAGAVLDRVVSTLPNFPLLDAATAVLSDAVAMLTFYGMLRRGTPGSDQELRDVEQVYADTIVNSEGKVLSIPPRPDVGGRDRRKRR